MYHDSIRSLYPPIGGVTGHAMRPQRGVTQSCLSGQFSDYAFYDDGGRSESGDGMEWLLKRLRTPSKPRRRTPSNSVEISTLLETSVEIC